MNIRDYQIAALTTDQLPFEDPTGIMKALLGLAGEAGSLATEFKKHLLEGDVYVIYPDRLAEELGDILWYLSNIASRSSLDLSEIARQNLTKLEKRYSATASSGFYDSNFTEPERLPRHFEITFTEDIRDDTPAVLVKLGDRQLGDPITDNTYADDGYRFHDVFHYSYAAILGWSPVVRANINCKRKSNAKIDEVEDGARAAIIEELISLDVFLHAKDHAFFKNASDIDSRLLSAIQAKTKDLEVADKTFSDWTKAILEGYAVWRQMTAEHGGVIIGDLNERTVSYRAPP